MKDLRVALCGSSGTGKSTLAKWISETYHLPINPNGARSVAKEMGFDSPYDVDKAGRRSEFQKKVVVAKCAWENEHDSFVTDRSHIDNTVYTMMHDIKVLTDEFLDSNMKALSRYTHFIYCPVSVFCDLDDDPVRVKNTAYHKVYDVALQGFIKTYVTVAGGPYFMALNDRTLEDRKVSVEAMLSYGASRVT